MRQLGGAGQGAAYGRLFELMRHVTSSRDVDEMLDRVVRGVVEGLGFGTAILNQLQGEHLVCTHVWSATDHGSSMLGRRVPIAVIEELHEVGEAWGSLRFVRHDRLPVATDPYTAVPDIEEPTDPGGWHPLDVLSAPLRSATGDLLGTMSVDLPPGLRIPGHSLRELLEMYVVQAGLALSHAQQRAILERRVRLDQMVTDVSATAHLADLADLPAMLESVAGTITCALSARQTFVRCHRADQDASELVVAAPVTARATSGIQELSEDLLTGSWPERRSILLDLSAPSSPELPRSMAILCERIPAGAVGRVVLTGFGVGTEMLGTLAVVLDADRALLDVEEEQALQEVADELGQLVLNARLFDRESRLVGELRELDRYKSELIATISHELKTPLTSIIGHAELLDDEDDTSISVRAISRNAFRLDRLISNLLSYSRLHDQRPHVRQPVDLASLCRAAVELLMLPAEKADLAWSVSLPRDGVVVRGDVEELGQAVDNILGNAVKYSERGGVVEVVAGYDGGDAFVTVRDTGLGISRGDQAHLFSPFHRSSNPEALSMPGSGLGLAIARRVVDLHGGVIGLDSTLGVGSTFTLRLPRADGA